VYERSKSSVRNSSPLPTDEASTARALYSHDP
jgi:hypothetical protein